MSNTKHTPGTSLGHQLPEGFSVVKEIASNCGRLLVLGYAQFGKQMFGKVSEDEARANATLWAEAPMLLALVRSYATTYPLAELTDKARESIERATKQ